MFQEKLRLFCGYSGGRIEKNIFNSELKHDWVALGGQHMDAKGITPATRNIIDLNVFLRIKFSDPPQGLILAIVHSQRR